MHGRYGCVAWVPTRGQSGVDMWFGLRVLASLNILFMLVCGAIVNGPYALITTAVSADLGSHKSLKVCAARHCVPCVDRLPGPSRALTDLSPLAWHACVHEQDDSKLLASVTGIIDGTGSIGAALQGVLISWISSQYSWNAVFYALIAW